MHVLSRHWQTLKSLFNFEASVNTASLHIALFWVLLGNFAFWHAMSDALGPFNLHAIVFMAGLAVIITALINLLLMFVSFPTIFKPVVIVLLLCSAAASYFMQSYGVMLDMTMLQNILETHPSEALELLSLKLVFSIVLFGVLPVLVIARTRIVYKSWARESLAKVLGVGITLCVILATLFIGYKDFVSFGRNHSEMKHLINPLNYIIALKHYGAQHWVQKKPINKLGEDAQVLTAWENRGKKNLTILVIGETARASNFSLNAMPTELAKPCPSGPVVVSTPGVRPISGWPGVLLWSWRKFFNSVMDNA